MDLSAAGTLPRYSSGHYSFSENDCPFTQDGSINTNYVYPATVSQVQGALHSQYTIHEHLNSSRPGTETMISGHQPPLAPSLPLHTPIPIPVQSPTIFAHEDYFSIPPDFSAPPAFTTPPAFPAPPTFPTPPDFPTRVSPSQPQPYPSAPEDVSAQACQPPRQNISDDEPHMSRPMYRPTYPIPSELLEEQSPATTTPTSFINHSPSPGENLETPRRRRRRTGSIPTPPDSPGFDVTDPDLISSHEKKRHYLECLENYIVFLHEQLARINVKPVPLERVSHYRGLSSRSLRTLLVHMYNGSRTLGNSVLKEERRFVSLRDELFRRHAAATVATRYDGVVARRYPRQTFTRVPNAANANAEMQSQVSADGNWSIDTQAAMAARRYAMMAIPSSQFLPHEQETLRVGATEMQRYEPAASHGYTATQSFPIPPMHMTFGPASAATSSYASGTSMSLAANNISFGSYF